MNTDQPNKPGQQNQPSTQKLNEQQQHQGGQQTPKPDTAKEPQAPANAGAGAEAKKS
ncbi:MAG TPA: hypothetical protein VGH23_11205 [Rhizomicrobium sp.]|jgi:hypothetical protein